MLKRGRADTDADGVDANLPDDVTNVPPLTFDLLPADAVSKIFEHLPFRDFLVVRKVCSRFNNISIRTPLQWRTFLKERGPKQITKNSIHPKVFPSCKAGKNGYCNVGLHYTPESLCPIFNDNGIFQPYRVVLNFASKRKLLKLRTHRNWEVERQKRIIDELAKPQAQDREALYRQALYRYSLDQVKVIIEELNSKIGALKTERRKLFRATRAPVAKKSKIGKNK